MKQVVTLFNILFILSLLVACGSAAIEPEVEVTTAVAQPATQEATATVEVAQVTATAVATDLPPTATATTPPTSPPPSPTPSPLTTAVTEELIFALPNQEEQAIRSVAIVGQTAFVGVGSQLVMVDITDPTDPQMIGESEQHSTAVGTVLVQNGVAYVGTQSSIAAWDVSNPQAPNLLTTAELDETIVQLAWHGETLIVAAADLPVDNPQDGTARIITLDSQLQLLGSIDLPWELPWNVGSGAIALADGILYASNTGQETFFAIDLQDPTTLPDPIPFSVAILTYSLQAHGQTLYVGGGFSNIMAWDVSDLASPQKLWEIQAESPLIPAAGVVKGFVVDGNRIYVDAVTYHGELLGPLIVELPDPVATESGSLLSTHMGMVNELLIVGREYPQAGLYFYTIPVPDAQ